MVGSNGSSVAAKSRAVLRRIEPGGTTPCAHCATLVKFKAAAKSKNHKVIANVYEDGKWQRVEHYHEDCYVEAGEPYGEAAA